MYFTSGNFWWVFLQDGNLSSSTSESLPFPFESSDMTKTWSSSTRITNLSRNGSDFLEGEKGKNKQFEVWDIIHQAIITTEIIHWPSQPPSTLVVHCIKYQKSSVNLQDNWFNWHNRRKCSLTAAWSGIENSAGDGFWDWMVGHTYIMKTFFGEVIGTVTTVIKTLF